MHVRAPIESRRPQRRAPAVLAGLRAARTATADWLRRGQLGPQCIHRDRA